MMNIKWCMFLQFSSRIGEIMTEIVNDYGVVWVASAGNHGSKICISFKENSIV